MSPNLQPQQYRAAPISVPDSPPELVSPSSSTYSSLASEGLSTWRSRSNGPISPSMSHYEQPGDLSRRGSPMVLQIRSDMAGQQYSSISGGGGNVGGAPKQQLPSLSSLFPSSIRTHTSPMSERPPSHFAASPLELPRSAGGYLERSGSSSSYFPTMSSSVSSSRPVVYEPKLLENPSSAYPHQQHRTEFPGPLSPHRADSSSSSSSSRWSFHQDVARGSSEYSFGGRDHAARYQPSQIIGHKHDHDGYRRQGYRDAMMTSPHQYQPPQPAHHHAAGHAQASYSHHGSSQAATGEAVPSKDGLGPKIWTGTHFLPRFVRAAELPGEGLCYFYDDGSHCKTVIDGEAVNAHWGVTKAGKPRKRLAIACVTCREKKIKCDPDYPRCIQCEKFGRVCKFKNAPRGGGHHTTGSSGSPTEHEVESPQHQRGPMYELPRPRHSPSVSPRTTELPLTLAPPPKRLKYDPAHPSETGTGHHGGQSLPSWRQQMDHQQAYSRAGQLPPLPRLHHDESRWRSESYPPGFPSVNDALGGRPQVPPRLPRLSDARV